MAYNGPESGVLNIIPRTTSGTVSATPVTPSADLGSGGDYCLDLNTNTLFGPKDPEAANPWPLTGLTIGNGRYTWRGPWSSANSYNAGDIVHYNGSQYLCLKSVTYGTPAVWAAGAYDAGTYVTYSGTLYVAVNNATSAHTPGSATTIWEEANPQQDAASSYAAQDNWTSLAVSVEADTFFTTTNGPTRLSVPRRALLFGGYPIAPNGIQTGSATSNYIVDSDAVNNSTTLKLSNNGTFTLTPSVIDGGAGVTLELRASGVTASPSNTGYSRVTVDQYGRITAASNGLQTTWETRSTAGSALTSANFAVEFTGSTALTCTLAAPSSAVAGRVHVIKNSTTQNLTVQCTGTPANSINNSTSYTIPTGTTVMFIASDTSASGQGWRVITNVLVNQANTFTAAQTIQPATDGTVLSVTNNAGTYSPFAVSTSTGITTVKQGLQFSSVFDSTTAAEFKASDSTTVLGVDTTNKVITSSTQATASGTALSSTNKLVDSKATVSGTVISVSNPIVDAASAAIERPNGTWLYPWHSSTITISAAVARGTRFTAMRPLTIKTIAFNVTTASNATETIQVGIFNASNGNLLQGSGNATLYTTAGGSTTTSTTSTGTKYVTLNGTTGYTLTAGTVYYIAIATTYASTANWAIGAGAPGTGAQSMFGTAYGTAEAVNASATSTLANGTFSTSGTYTTTLQPTFALLTT